ncbi:MAG: hypothetical protein ACRDD1_20895 [Planctomycetia bacterium]
MNDPIVDEVRRIREEHAAEFDYDLRAIFEDVKRRQEESGLTFVSFADETDQVGPPTESLDDLVNRRVDEIRSGKVKGIPADEVFAELRAKFS